ncbi:nucleotide disphospho-sugar-binding domain-containing protein [Crossiella cryophila]|uniref:UDP:flavonoid glycosyltransferase YjiC (YdhE family) n=1 Tax=Crossiella cryophila TaxID=43355 RepID=A0A7W7FSG7_9PSEU|nr:nucleotide disphospho-sugar-binding domain-containing protein [Crossiella cryophila]MBB4675920.1 UDP:flavonoid glycosyltransferase YjiC (YdhE family) [Crossiella cryophila]
MRVLFTSSAGLGHLFPMISTAWALRAAGHEVRVATTGPAATAAANAGLVAVESCPGIDWEAEIQRIIQENFGAEGMASPKPGEPRPDSMASAGVMFAHMADLATDETVRQAALWRPDLVIYDLTDATGPIVAAKLGIPCVQHGFGLTNAQELFDAMVPFLADTFTRLGVDGLAEKAAAIDVAPPSLEGELKGISTRYVPYNGGAVLPEWLSGPKERPRIVITMGTAMATHVGLNPWRAILDVAVDADAELILAAGSMDLTELGELPPHVRTIGYLPLGALLGVCDALVHHGGSGSTLTAVDAGVTQLIVPQGADQFYNAERIAKRGAGLSAEHEGVTAEQIHRLLHDADIKTAVAEVKAEMAAQPSPAELVPQLEAIAGH